MGILKDTVRGVAHPLPAVAIVGRAGTCQVRIDAPYVSSEHAAIRWTGDGWEVRDLASRNGTFVAGHRLDPGQRVRLPVGTPVAFGRASEVWTLGSANPPLAAAVSGSEQRWATDELLLLPGTDDPEVGVYADGRGGWLAEAGDRVWPVADGAEVTAGGRTWKLQLPSVVTPTREVDEDAARAADLTFTFHVSRDEEHVELAVSEGTRTWRLGHRAHHYLLLTLARARLEGESEGLPAMEQGWLYHDELARGLGLTTGHFNTAVFRVRQQLKEAGVPGADGILERRRGSGQIRITVGRVVIEAG